MGEGSAAARGAGTSGERGVSASGVGKMDCSLRSAQARFADSVAGCFASAAHWHQTLPLHGGKFLAAAACFVGRRSERTSGSVGGGDGSGCVVGDSHRDTGV